MNFIKLGLFAASMVGISTASAHEKWQFVITAESPAFSTTLEVEYDPVGHALKPIINQTNVKGNPVFKAGEEPQLNLQVTSANDRTFNYELIGDLPVSTEDGLLLRPISIDDSAQLRNGYLNYHQRGDIKITMYGQQIACTD